MSKETVLNSGAPQGCVLSPILFFIYTDHMMYQNAVTCLSTFAGVMALVELLLDETSWQHIFHMFHSWTNNAKESFLEMNVNETKELVLDARNTNNTFVPVKKNDESVEVVSSFKYFGTLIDSKLRFNDNADLI